MIFFDIDYNFSKNEVSDVTFYKFFKYIYMYKKCMDIYIKRFFILVFHIYIYIILYKINCKTYKIIKK